MSKKQTKRLKSKKTGLPKSNRGCKGVDEKELILRIYFNKPPLGMTNKQIAEWLGISESLFYELKADNVEFMEALKFYSGESHLEVLKSFKKIACGFNFTETKREPRKDKETGEYKLVITEEVDKYVPPNATAGIFYLKNKMPDHFKDKIETEHSFAQGMLDQITFVIKGKSNG